MATRYIYLSNELNEKLKKEPNASGLIQQLLNEHYVIQEVSSKDIEAEIEAKKQELSLQEKKELEAQKEEEAFKAQRALQQSLGEELGDELKSEMERQAWEESIAPNPDETNA